MVYISEVGSDEKIPVPVDKDNLLPLNRLNRYFPSAVGLYFEENGTEKIPVAFDETDTMLIPPEGGWSNRVFYVVHPRVCSRLQTRMSMNSRPATSIEASNLASPYLFDKKLADDLRKRLFFVPRNQKALRESRDAADLTVFMGKDEIDGGCVSPISTRAAVTYAHKSHSLFTEFTEGESDDFNVHSIVEIRNCENITIHHQMKVIVINVKHDFILLHSLDGTEIFHDYPHSLRPPKDFEWFLGFGLSHETHSGQHITHRTGRICSIEPDYRGRYLASSSIDSGDSGGPCYSADRALIGIMVSSTTTDPRLNFEYDQEIVEEKIKDTSSNPADTWITPGNFFAEAYKTYLVKQGILQVRAERELGEPKPKRRAINKT